jgi:hypothetical protein
MEQRKYCGRCTNAECEHRNHDGRHAGVQAQLARRVFEQRHVIGHSTRRACRSSFHAVSAARRRRRFERTITFPDRVESQMRVPVASFDSENVSGA